MEKPASEKKDAEKGELIEKKICTEIKDMALAMSEISLLIHTYDDIFSDFDPRSYSQRALSEDFLSEIKRASLDKSAGPLEMRFMIEANKRNPEREAIIKKRLHEHFRHHYEMLRKDKKKTRNEGITYTAIGAVMILLATFNYPQQASSFLNRLVFVILEPTGWFISWYGLERIFRAPEILIHDIQFYKKMATCEIRFFGY